MLNPKVEEALQAYIHDKPTEPYLAEEDELTNPDFPKPPIVPGDVSQVDLPPIEQEDELATFYTNLTNMQTHGSTKLQAVRDSINAKIAQIREEQPSVLDLEAEAEKARVILRDLDKQ